MQHSDKFSDLLIKPMLECEWNDFMAEKKIVSSQMFPD